MVEATPAASPQTQWSPPFLGEVDSGFQSIFYKVMQVFKAVQSVGRKATGFLAYVQILWLVWWCRLTTFLASACWNTLFLNCGEPRPVLACERPSLSGMLPLIATLSCIQLTCSPVECSKQVLTEHSSTFLALYCRLGAAGIEFTEQAYPNTLKSTLNIAFNSAQSPRMETPYDVL